MHLIPVLNRYFLYDRVIQPLSDKKAVKDHKHFQLNSIPFGIRPFSWIEKVDILKREKPQNISDLQIILQVQFKQKLHKCS